MISGQTLINLGYKPGKWFKEAIAHVNDKSLIGQEFTDYLDSMVPKTIEPFEEPVKYHINLQVDGDSLDELRNVSQVLITMDEVMKTPTVVAGAIMPDACPTGEIGQIPVGGVVVTKNAIHPNMHSADICCSLMLSNFGFIDPKTVLDAAHSITHFGPGGRKEHIGMPKALFEAIEGNPFLNSPKSIELAKSHMGTQGDGNHFLFVGTSKLTGETCMVTHHGSRGFGANLYKEGMRVAERYRRELSPKTMPRNAWIPFDTKDGENYWNALQIVRDWTKRNHETIHTLTSIRLGRPYNYIFNEHNFVFKDGDLFTHAKGATPLKALPDDNPWGLRIIPMNMAEPILIVRGEETTNNLGFAPHGAGRNFSRGQHKRNNTGLMDRDLFDLETEGIDARFFSGKIDISELPSAYKDADSVKAQIELFNLGEIVDEIIPYGCIMAGEFDMPWRNK